MGRVAGYPETLSLSERQIEIWSRQIILPELGGRGQERLLAGRIRLLGTDLAAATAATYLAGAGIGTLEVEASLLSASPFAPLDDRIPGIRIVTSPQEAPADILLCSAPVAQLLPAARLGSLVIDQEADGTTSLLLLPRGGAACLQCAVRPAQATPSDVAAASMAGSLAALVATRWLAEIQQETDCLRWVLAPEAPTWEFAPLATQVPCPAADHGL